MIKLKHQPWVIDPTSKDMIKEIEWNMWRVRAWPFLHLVTAEGARVREMA